jgi:hypothetical protein
VTQVIEHLPSKCEVLSSNPSPAKTKTKQKQLNKTLLTKLRDDQVELEHPKCYSPYVSTVGGLIYLV